MRFDKQLENIKTYEAGKPIELVVREFGIDAQEIVKLASNENPYGCSPKVEEAIKKIAHKAYLYPDDSMYQLKEALSKRFLVDKSEIIVGSGSDQVIEFLMHAKAKNSTILINSVTFAMYEIYAAHVGADVIRTESLTHNLDEFYRLYLEHKPSVIFLCTPNNPTGDALKADDLFEFLQKIDSETLVVVDGAYMEYASAKDQTCSIEPSTIVEKFENVIYLGTFSKAYGLGGMRVGYGIAQKQIIEALYKLRAPFNVTTLSLEAAVVALEDQEFVDRSIELNFEQMAHFEKFAQQNNIEFIKSYTNFITLLFNEPLNSTRIAIALLKQGMIVRDLAGYHLNAIRITIGKESDNQKLFRLLREALA